MTCSQWRQAIAFTYNCDVLVTVSEATLNRRATHVMRRRPSLLSLGSPSLVEHPELLCSPIRLAHPKVAQRGRTVSDQIAPRTAWRQALGLPRDPP